jgi:hypothetical protein
MVKNTICQLYLFLIKSTLLKFFNYQYIFNSNFSYLDCILSLFTKKYFSLSYKKYYLKADLVKAYASLVMFHIVNCKLRSKIGKKRSISYRRSRIYLAFLMTREVCLFLEQEIKGVSRYIDLEGLSKINTRIWKKKGYSDKKKIFIFGPFAEEKDYKYFSDRSMILFKPDDISKKHHGNVELFLNKSHVKNLPQDVYNAVYNESYSKIYFRDCVPQEYCDINKTRLAHDCNSIKGFLALNRLFYNHIHCYGSVDAVIVGINYFLTENKYSKNYPDSVAHIGVKRDRNYYLSSFLEHDLLLNYMASKYFIETGYVTVTESKEFVDIISMGVNKFIKKINHLYKL